MKIEKRGAVITGVPGIHSIEVDAQGQILLRMTATDVGSVWDAGPLGLFVEALQAALDVSLEVRTGAARTSREPRVFTRETGIPADVTRVLDVDDDPWERSSDGELWSAPKAGYAYGDKTDDELLSYAPLIEILL
jgi:hypothetical protein